MQAHIYYGDASGHGAQSDALAIVTFVPDPTGNAQGQVVAYFRQQPGGYRLIHKSTKIAGLGLAPGSQVVFANGRASFDTLTLNPNDGRCCPTGHKHISLSLQ